jgi:thiamine monophosphate kinase
MNGGSMQDEVIGEYGEEGLKDAFIFPAFGDNTLEVDVGDDAGVVRVAEDVALVATTDYVPTDLFARTHGLMDARELGHYAVTCNASDLAAMGAVAVGFTVVITAPPELPAPSFLEL